MINENINIPNFQSKYNYENSIKTLNGLISNSNKIAKRREKQSEFRLGMISKTKMFIERASLSMSDIDNLKVIHVAGTKGKGSTCTYIEAILRNHGYTTGLFTSPHIKEVRERIKINGVPISMDNFSTFFWYIFNQLSSSQNDNEDLPSYFQFLTIMAFGIFLKEKVDFVILEAGIGGRFDSTNFISHPIISCITSLGFDHMEILGSTISEIAWHKSGIIKPESIVFTCDNQPKEAFSVIENEILLTKSKLYLVSTFGQQMLNIINRKICIHRDNAFLASAVCQRIIKKDLNFDKVNNGGLQLCNTVVIIPENCITEEYKKIINSTQVIGRYQIISKLSVEYYIDGAHTVESIKTTIEWFREIALNREYEKRYLVFMITGSRSVHNLLFELMVLSFDGVLLSPLKPFFKNQPCDFAIDNLDEDKEHSKLMEIASTWKYFKSLKYNKDESLIKFFDCFSDINNWLIKSSRSTQVLVVGSLHLVGCALAVLS